MSNDPVKRSDAPGQKPVKKTAGNEFRHSEKPGGEKIHEAFNGGDLSKPKPKPSGESKSGE